MTVNVCLAANSLSASVRMTEATECHCDHTEGSEIATNLPTEELKESLLICTSYVKFEFNGPVNCQKDGLSVGSLFL